jgi:3-hydroxybutyrate dehydrogenase
MVEAAAELGDLRYVANIAGLQHISPIEEFPTEKYDLMHDVMLRAPFLVAKHAIPHIRETDDGVGAIGNMASIHGHIATQDKVAYISAKFGLRGLTQCIAAEGEGTLRSFSISTGYVKTPLVTNQIPDTAAERGISEEEVVEDVMLGESRVTEMMEPVDVANLFTFGFSKRARHLNGGDLTFDGGHLFTY